MHKINNLSNPMYPQPPDYRTLPSLLSLSSSPLLRSPYRFQWSPGRGPPTGAVVSPGGDDPRVVTPGGAQPDPPDPVPDPPRRVRMLHSAQNPSKPPSGTPT